jgi:hypothetical protein
MIAPIYKKSVQGANTPSSAFFTNVSFDAKKSLKLPRPNKYSYLETSSS